ncbi:bacterial regulatory helix-turn-helix protein, lysR family domain-containing protein [Ditylenchus destructor]|nr:bacterial regulatory helix-turn-helix protein, lysR family domain-containing protein [Ditylenchus destructor]
MKAARRPFMAINELRSITTFIKAAELGSLRKAAADLGISPQAASKALAQLEAHLDVRLFHRTTRVMSLTDAGQRLFEDVRPAVTGMHRALQSAKSARDEFAGPLRITGPRTTFQPILWRLVDEFWRYASRGPARRPAGRPYRQNGWRIAWTCPSAVHLLTSRSTVCPSRWLTWPHTAAAPIGIEHGESAAVAGEDRRQAADQPVVPTICSNDELFELQAVLAREGAGPARGRHRGTVYPLRQADPHPRGPHAGLRQLLRLLRQQVVPASTSPCIHRFGRSRLADNPEYVLNPSELRGKVGRPGRA